MDANGVEAQIQANQLKVAPATSSRKPVEMPKLPTNSLQLPTVRTLIAAGVPVNHVNDLGWTALHEAIVLGNGDRDHVTVVRLLLEAGADATIPDRNGALPRQLAADAGHTAIVAELDRH
jgi:uncharacterized protein